MTWLAQFVMNLRVKFDKMHCRSGLFACGFSNAWASLSGSCYWCRFDFGANVLDGSLSFLSLLWGWYSLLVLIFFVLSSLLGNTHDNKYIFWSSLRGRCRCNLAQSCHTLWWIRAYMIEKKCPKRTKCCG